MHGNVVMVPLARLACQSAHTTRWQLQWCLGFASTNPKLN